MSRSRSKPNKPAKPIFIVEFLCMCGRPKKNKRGRCELCKTIGVRNPLAPAQYKWLENQKGNPPINNQIRDIGFGELKKVCGQCVHLNRHRFKDIMSDKTKSGFACKNVTTVEPWNPYWPACHNFQERDGKTVTEPKSHKLEVHKK